MKKTRIILFTILSCLLLTAVGTFVFLLASRNGNASASVSTESTATAPTTQTVESTEPVYETEPVPTEEAFPEKDITLMAVGDDLLHMGIVKTGKQEDGSYDFSCLFDGISDFLSVADIKIINQETILGGNELGFSGYPRFNSPTEAGDAIAAAGFNVVLQASNHSADKGIEGLLNCITFWESHPEVLMSGLVKDSEVQSEIPLLTIEDVTFAVLNYTYSPNSETIPSSVVGHLNMLCSYNEKNRLDFTTLNPQVIEDIKRAEEIADVVIVCPHWGTEYSTTPSRYQKEFAMQMAEAGADLIIGTHPHVIQPVEWVYAENGNRALCYYSLGNYVSTQKKEICMLEAMAWVNFHVAEDGITITQENTGVLPMVCHYNSGPVRFEKVYLLEDYTEEQADSHGIRAYGGVVLKLEDLKSWSDEILNDWVLSKEQVLNQSHSESQ